LLSEVEEEKMTTTIAEHYLETVRMVRMGHVISAIIYIREKYALTIREAQDLVHAIGESL
jgi:hypothetical protein